STGLNWLPTGSNRLPTGSNRPDAAPAGSRIINGLGEISGRLVHFSLRTEPHAGPQPPVGQRLRPLDEGAGALHGQDVMGDVGEVAAEMHRALDADDLALAGLDAEIAVDLLVRRLHADR